MGRIDCLPGKEDGTGLGLRGHDEVECLVGPSEVRVVRNVTRTTAVVGVENTPGDAVVEG